MDAQRERERETYLYGRVGDELERANREEQDACRVFVAAEEGGRREAHPGLQLVGRGELRRRAELEKSEGQRRKRVDDEEDEDVVAVEAVVWCGRRVPEPRRLRPRQASPKRRLRRRSRRVRDHPVYRHSGKLLVLFSLLFLLHACVSPHLPSIAASSKYSSFL